MDEFLDLLLPFWDDVVTKTTLSEVIKIGWWVHDTSACKMRMQK